MLDSSVRSVEELRRVAVQNATRRIFAALAIGALSVIALLSLLPGDARPHTGASGNIEHFFAYLIAAVFLRLWLESVPVWKLCLAMTCIAAGLELAQFIVPGRNVRLDNWLSSAIGCCCGAAAAWGGRVMQRRLVQGRL